MNKTLQLMMQAVSTGIQEELPLSPVTFLFRQENSDETVNLRLTGDFTFNDYGGVNFYLEEVPEEIPLTPEQHKEINEVLLKAYAHGILKQLSKTPPTISKTHAEIQQKKNPCRSPQFCTDLVNERKIPINVYIQSTFTIHCDKCGSYWFAHLPEEGKRIYTAIENNIYWSRAFGPIKNPGIKIPLSFRLSTEGLT